MPTACDETLSEWNVCSKLNNNTTAAAKLIFSHCDTRPFVDIIVSYYRLTYRTHSITHTLLTDDWRHQQHDNMHKLLMPSKPTTECFTHTHTLYKRQKYTYMQRAIIITYNLMAR